MGTGLSGDPSRLVLVVGDPGPGGVAGGDSPPSAIDLIGQFL